MAVKSATDTFEAALAALKERRVELAKFLTSPQTTRDDVSRWITQIVATQEAIKAIGKALEEQRAADGASQADATSSEAM
jgi:hypothetical protein